MPMSPYVERLRAVVGHDLLLLPSAAVLPRRDDGAVLLALHHHGAVVQCAHPSQRSSSTGVRPLPT